MEGITLENKTYKIYENYKDGFDLETLKERYTDYFEPFDYILGDWSYGSLRLKGFYKPNNKKCKDYNNIDNYKDYIKNNCAYDCKYFIIEKIIE